MEEHMDDLGGHKLPNSLCVTPFLTPESFFDNQEKEIFNQIELEKIRLSNLDTLNVPEDYFNTLENNILSKISEIKLKEQIGEENFGVPENYFEELSFGIDNKIKESNLKSLVSEDGFQIPDAYFTTLEQAIQHKISKENIKSIVGNSVGMFTPNAYFENLEENIKSKIQFNEQVEKNPEKIFSTPEHYFENLSADIFAKINRERNTEFNPPIITTLPNRRNSWLKYSAAAVVILLGIGSYFSIQTNEKLDSNTVQQNAANSLDLQKISDDELINYLAQVSDDDADLLHLTKIIEEKNGKKLQFKSTIEDDDIEEYLNYML